MLFVAGNQRNKNRGVLDASASIRSRFTFRNGMFDDKVIFQKIVKKNPKRVGVAGDSCVFRGARLCARTTLITSVCW